jgi:BCD family chlorophyll transporter-like MFS transporter
VAASEPQRFRPGRIARLGIFHIGSSFVDLLTSGVLNRVLITDLALSATPVALLSALRYLLAPLGVWFGARSDSHPIGGYRRLPYIWLGRLPMLLSLPLLPIAVGLLMQDPASVNGWLLAAVAYLVYGVGTLMSGSTYLSLVRDNAPPQSRGQALAIVQVFLIVSFPVAGIIYAQMMPDFVLQRFVELIWFGMGSAFVFIAVALWRSERRVSEPIDLPPPAPPLPQLLREMWADRRARRFVAFLALGATSAFAQDAVLEPFGGDVFGLSVGETTRFNAYWGSGVVVSLLLGLFLSRRRAADEQVPLTVIGLAATALPLVLLGVTALTATRALVIPALVLFGFGFGIYTVGAVSLLAAMTTDERAGAYLGLWSMVQLLFRGLGIFLGGFIRDVALAISGSYTVAYGSVFLLEAVGLLLCIPLLLSVDVRGFARGGSRSFGTAERLAAAGE